MSSQPTDRREFQRLRIDEGIDATFGEAKVRLLEIGVIGARVEHQQPQLEGSNGPLVFEWEGESIQLECTPVWTDPADGSYCSGLRFSRALGESDDTLRRMLSSRVKRLIERDRNRHSPKPEQVDGDDTLKGKDAGFVTYYMEEGTWRKAPSLLPDQPEAGFTVAVGEDEDEMAMLCQSYEEADSEGMRLIKLFAELSVSEALGVPPRE